ncbi:MAG: hypothetical protein ACOC1F_01200, partial [Myxococcota bacterium]
MRSVYPSIATVVGACVVAIALSVGGCKTETGPNNRAPAAKKSATAMPERSAKPEPTVTSAPIPKSEVEAAVNPAKLPPYTGPTGVVQGTVKLKGDEAPEVPLRLPAKCMGAQGTYGRLFREGDKRAAPDVLVAVTG